MTPTTLTVAQVVTQVVKTVGEMTAVTSFITLFATEAAKNWGLASKWAGLFAYVAGFAIGVTLNGVVTGSYFGGISLLVGFLAGLVAAGGYSGISALSNKSDATAPKAPDTTATS